MDKQELSYLLQDEPGEETVCPWCHAVDRQKVLANIVGTLNFPDSTILILGCPRCGGQSSYYIRGWEHDYLRERILTLHPEMGHIDEDVIVEVGGRLWPEGDKG